MFRRQSVDTLQHSAAHVRVEEVAHRTRGCQTPARLSPRVPWCTPRFIRTLVSRAFDCLVADALVTTSDEEQPVLRAAVRELGATLDAPSDARESALVGDTLRHCLWRRG